MENSISRDGFHEGLSNKWCCHCTQWFFLFRHFQTLFYSKHTEKKTEEKTATEKKMKKNFFHSLHASSLEAKIPFACWYSVLSLMNRAFPTFNSICWMFFCCSLIRFIPHSLFHFMCNIHNNAFMMSAWTCFVHCFDLIFFLCACVILHVQRKRAYSHPTMQIL